MRDSNTPTIPENVRSACECGLSIVPVGGDKRPLMRWADAQHERPTLAQLEAWQAAHNPRAWAVVCGAVSGVVALDFDGPEGEALIAKWNLQPHVKTPRGGAHVYVKHPGHNVRTMNYKVSRELACRFAGLDVRGDGGYALFQGSTGDGEYVWQREFEPLDWNDLPAELREFLAPAPEPPERNGKAPDVSRNGAGPLDEPLPERELRRRVLLALGSAPTVHGGLLAVGRSLVDRSEVEIEQAAPLVADLVGALGRDYSEADVRRNLLDGHRFAVDHELRPPRDERRSGASTDRPSWPAPLDDAAFHGVAGQLVSAIAPRSEADIAALLVQLLVGAGNAIGRSAGFLAEGSFHPPILSALVVGDTAASRKGSSWAQVRRPLAEAAPPWAEERIVGGLSSGEGLIFHVRDQVTTIKRDEEIISDPGVLDKRLLVVESEFASVLRVMARDGNTLGAVLRQAWDGGTLATLTRNSPLRATGAHVSIIGHVTLDELRRELRATDQANGFANRFLFICAKRSKFLPEGGGAHELDLSAYVERLRSAIERAQTRAKMFRQGRIVERDEEARGLWREVYRSLSEGRPGMFGAVTARGEAQTMRIALVYALLDDATRIGVAHLRAALAVWRYAESSARFVFGDALGDSIADEALRALRQSPDGLTRTQLRDRFSRHAGGDRLSSALDELAQRGLASVTRSETGGRPAEIWKASRDGAT